MSTPKILGMVTSCGTCPNHKYDSGGVSECVLVHEAVRDKSIVAPFCPLPDFPSRVIAGQQMTILGLREPNTYSFDFALLSHVATKLKLNVHASGLGIMLPLGDDREVYLNVDFITGVTIRPFEIIFRYEEREYRLSPDAHPPLLREATNTKGDLWLHHPIK
jgi:hypothetical protein